MRQVPTIATCWRDIPEKIRDVVWDLVIAKRQRGETYRQIAESVGISKTTAFRLCNHVAQLSLMQLCELSLIPHCMLEHLPENIEPLNKRKRKPPPKGWPVTLQIIGLQNRLSDMRARQIKNMA